MSTNQNPCSPLEWQGQFLRLLADMFTDSRMKNNKTLAKYHSVIAIGGYLGIRAKALLSLSFSDLLDKDSAFLKESKVNKKRKVVIQDKLKIILQQNFEFIDPKNPTKPIIINKQGGKISTGSFNAQLKKVFEVYGIVTDNPSSVTLRKTYAYRLWDLGGKSETALLAVQKALGHKTKEYTMDYLGITGKMVANLQLMM